MEIIIAVATFITQCYQPHVFSRTFRRYRKLHGQVSASENKKCVLYPYIYNIHIQPLHTIIVFCASESVNSTSVGKNISHYRSVQATQFVTSLRTIHSNSRSKFETNFRADNVLWSRINSIFTEILGRCSSPNIATVFLHLM